MPKPINKKMVPRILTISMKRGPRIRKRLHTFVNRDRWITEHSPVSMKQIPARTYFISLSEGDEYQSNKRDCGSLFLVFLVH
jgi:hypothetical protein